jgi:choline dehydrogenase-like flavoprotein
MILDFGGQERAALDRVFDVCVVGSGPAGITLARALAARGGTVALMEAGDREFSTESQDLYAGENAGLDYFPADVTRLRYFGGNSNHWGGRCRALDAHDFLPRPYHPLSGWPIGREDLDPYAEETDAILDLPPARALPDLPVEQAENRFAQVRFRFSPPTRFAEKYGDEIAASERIHLFLNANLVDLRLDADLATVAAAVFRSYRPGDPGASVRARHYCLCMGGLENPRFLLNARSQVPAGIGNGHDLVGRFFCEHPATEVGRILFEGAVPPGAGFAPSPAMLRANEVLNFNLLMTTHGLSLRRELARSLACANRFTKRLAAEVLGRWLDCGTGGLAKFFRERRRDDYRTGSLKVIAEQALNRDSRVTLGATRDRFGHRTLVLDWRLGELDWRTMRLSAVAMGLHLAEQGIGRVQVADWLLADDPEPAAGQITGLHHHMCTTRMSDDPRTGVVDRDCRVHGMSNLYIGGSSVFATVGHANPTYTIVQLALRLADHLGATLTAGIPHETTWRH